MTEDFNGKRKLNPKTKKLIIIVACIFVVAAVATTAIIIALSRRESVGDILELGDRYMSEMDYESAIREYKRAIEIDPKSEDAYIKLAEAYIAAGDVESAIKTLEDGYEATGSRRIRRRLEELREELDDDKSSNESKAPEPPKKKIPVPEKMEVDEAPQKTTYYVGETLDLTGLTFTVTFSDGTTREVSRGYTCDVKTLDEAGTFEVTVRYGNAETTVTVTVIGADAVEAEIEVMPGKLTYYVGEKLDLSGLKLTVTYENGEKTTVSDGFVSDIRTLDTAGIKTITVTYGNVSATYEVTVEPAPSGVDEWFRLAEYTFDNDTHDDGLTEVGEEFEYRDGCVTFGESSYFKSDVMLPENIDELKIEFRVRLESYAEYNISAWVFNITSDPVHYSGLEHYIGCGFSDGALISPNPVGMFVERFANTGVRPNKINGIGDISEEWKDVTIIYKNDDSIYVSFNGEEKTFYPYNGNDLGILNCIGISPNIYIGYAPWYSATVGVGEYAKGLTMDMMTISCTVK